ncbi:ribulose-phosphate 3-epimerase-like protein [Leptotrombidium deliense]|uniref:Ribulose-phosphate 3-epimerase n=1 Tax=Leptotrombidium deliense TaxID=299467 RepID=A0A443SF00_9ACAR|nr:ribulose-phosphate 3-epimerase-like protein [Leptotrombidium deliense]
MSTETQRKRIEAKIGPSILNANLADLGAECEKLMKAGADYLHLDVMDGHFVPNITFGHPVVKCLRRQIGGKPFFDMHMMVAEPEKWIVPMYDAGADQYTFHIEATRDAAACVRKIKENQMKVGIGIKPKTPIDVVLPFIKDVDVILIMTVEPGFGGQKFMSEMMPKVRSLRKEFPYLDIEVDGGVGPETIIECADAGANMIVSGTAVIQADDQQSVIKYMKDTVHAAINKQ